jgi:hypothetical protein
VIAIAGFLASRGLAWALGVRFDSAPIDYFWQYLDPNLLRDDLLGSLVHLHSQPPGFNGLLGLVLMLAADPGNWFALLYHGLGLATCLGLFVLLARLGMDPIRAGIASALFAASPTAVLYEHWLFYTHLVACFLVLAALLVQTLVARRRTRDAVMLSLVVAALACTRSLFHLSWAMAMTAGALLIVRRTDPKLRIAKLALAMAPALLLVVSIYAKNAVLFGTPASSTWLGMSLSKLTTRKLDPPLRESLVDAGELSPTALVRPFSPLSAYPRELTTGPPFGHPALDQVIKPGNYTNFNHGAYVRLNRLYLEDALYTIRNYPGTWLRSAGLAAMRYAIPPSQYGFISANAAAYAPIDRVYQILAGVPEAFRQERRREALGDPGYLAIRIRWLYVAAVIAAIGWACLRVRRSDDDTERAVLLFCVANALWVGVVANAVELGENQRFHAMVEPLHWVLVAWAFECVWLGRRSREQAANEG